MGMVAGGRARIVTASLALFLVLLPALLPPAAEAAPCPRGALTSKVTHVRDGDTIEVGGLAIRLNGLAAPAGNEPGGDEATKARRDPVLGRALLCALDGERTHDRCADSCYLDGADIAARVVGMGLARDCPRYSKSRYRAAAEQGRPDVAAARRAWRECPYM